MEFIKIGENRTPLGKQVAVLDESGNKIGQFSTEVNPRNMKYDSILDNVFFSFPTST
jgi:hypothetical protein